MKSARRPTSAGSALLATGLALFLAYLNTRTNLPWKFLFGVISIIPMMIPHILFAASWVLASLIGRKLTRMQIVG